MIKLLKDIKLSHLIEPRVDLEHVLSNVTGIFTLSFADDVAFGVCRSRRIWLVDTDFIEGTVHQVDQSDTGNGQINVLTKSESLIKL